jgi:hypothetical protein
VLTDFEDLISMSEPICSKCQGLMEEGFVPDTSYAALVRSAWFEGKPEKNLLGSLKVKGKRTFPIVTLRCSVCGFLEYYARTE